MLLFTAAIFNLQQTSFINEEGNVKEKIKNKCIRTNLK